MKNNRATSKPGGNAIAISRSQIVIYAIVALISYAVFCLKKKIEIQALTGETIVCGEYPDFASGHLIHITPRDHSPALFPATPLTNPHTADPNRAAYDGG